MPNRGSLSIFAIIPISYLARRSNSSNNDIKIRRIRRRLKSGPPNKIDPYFVESLELQELGSSYTVPTTKQAGPNEFGKSQ